MVNVNILAMPRNRLQELMCAFKHIVKEHGIFRVDAGLYRRGDTLRSTVLEGIETSLATILGS